MKLYLLIFLCSLIKAKRSPNNNVCNNLEAYHIKDFSKNCWYNPDVYSTAVDILRRHNKYAYENHTVITDDNYVLTIFRLYRVDYNKFKPSVYLSSTLLGSTTTWIDKEDESFAFVLADLGYDVWSGNFRGNLYSQNHVYLSRKQEPNKYWNFSFHEMGIYDLPVQLELIKKKTNQKIFYIGYSLGTTAALVYASLLPHHAKEHVHLFIMWTPVSYVTPSHNALGSLTRFINEIFSFIEFNHLSDVVAYTLPKLFKFFIGSYCFVSPGYAKLCSYLNNYVNGPGYKADDPAKYPLLYFNIAYGLGPKILTHYGQIGLSNGRFQYFDYNAFQRGNSTPPPEYPLKNINISIYIFYGGSDIIVGNSAVTLYQNLPNNVRCGIHKVNNYNHNNFGYAKNMNKLLYQPSIEILENHLTNRQKCNKWK